MRNPSFRLILYEKQGPASGSSCMTQDCHLRYGSHLRDTNKFSWFILKMRVRILYHDHCFDGAASAAFFSRFVEARFHPDAHFSYTGLAHKASQLFEPGMFDGDENAIVDFKYSTDPRLTWWFDHHQSAFLTPEDAEHFRHDTTGRKMYDPSFRSCTKYIATIAKDRFDFEAPDLAD